MNNTDTGKQISELATQIANTTTAIEQLAATLTDAGPSGSGIPGAVDLMGTLKAVDIVGFIDFIELTVDSTVLKFTQINTVPANVFNSLIGQQVIVTYAPEVPFVDAAHPGSPATLYHVAVVVKTA